VCLARVAEEFRGMPTGSAFGEVEYDQLRRL
jgi:hypothetical protein